MEKISKKFFAMINKDGGTIFGFYGRGHSCYEGGHRAHGGSPHTHTHTPGKTLVMVDFFNNAVSFVWDFTITKQTKNLTDVSVTKLWSIKQNDKPGNRKNLFLSLSKIVNLGIIQQDL